jgi:hypothetical protein
MGREEGWENYSRFGLVDQYVSWQVSDFLLNRLFVKLTVYECTVDNVDS